MIRWASTGVFAWCLRLELSSVAPCGRIRPALRQPHPAGPDRVTTGGCGPHSEHGIPELRRTAGRLMEHVRR